MKTTAVVLILFLMPSVLADNCTITGSWSDPAIIGGERGVFDLQIGPGSGFIDIEFFNMFNDLLWSEYHLQIPATYQIKIPTESDWINGSYRLEVLYDELGNGSDCGKVLVVPLEIRTQHNRTVSIDIIINQSYTMVDTPRTCVPITKEGSSFDVCAQGSVPPGLLESLKFNNMQIIPGNNMGSFNIDITQCTEDADLRASVKAMDDRLIAMDNERMMLTVENSKLHTLICGEGGRFQEVGGRWACNGALGEGGYISKITELNDEKSRLEAEKNARFDGGTVIMIAFIIIVLTVIALLFITRMIFSDKIMVTEAI